MSKEAVRKKVVTVRLREKEWKRLKRVAKSEKVSMGEMLRRGLSWVI